MKMLKTAITGIILSLVIQPLIAQHSGHDMGSMGGMGNGGYSNTDNSLKNMQKMVAIQATKEQASQLKSWTDNTSTLSRKLADLHNLTASNKSDDFSSAISALKAALDANNIATNTFLSSLSESQRSGLKKPVQKLQKINETLVKASAEIAGVSEQGAKVKQLGNMLQKTRKAVDSLHHQQQQLAEEMGAGVGI